MYKAFVRAKSGCDKWHDYEMTRCPYHDECVRYGCPAAEFAIKHGLTDIMPALCNVDFASMELLHAKLVRTTTCMDAALYGADGETGCRLNNNTTPARGMSRAEKPFIYP